MGNVDLYNASDIFDSTYSTIQAAINAASSGYKVKIGAVASPYYELLAMAPGVTLMPKSGEDVVISGAIEELVNDLNTGLWTLHDTVSGRSVYRYTYTASPFRISATRDNEIRLFTYDSYANLTAFATGQGIFFDDAVNRLYIILGTGTTNPNTVPIHVNAEDWCIDFNGDDNCTIEDLTIQHAGEAVIRLKNSDSNTIQRCNIKFGRFGVWLKNDGNACNNNIVQDNILYDTFSTSWTWDDAKGSALESSGVGMTSGGADNIFRRNEIFGYFNGVVCNNSDSGAPNLDGTLVYENVIHQIRDDAIELENYISNVEIFDNTIYDTYVGFSATPLLRGPVFIYRNRLDADRDANGQGRGFKGSNTQTRTKIKLYHNTMTANGNVLPMGNSTPSEITDFECYNNIFLVQSGEFAINGSPLHTEAGNEFNGNIYYRISGASNLFKNFDKNDDTQRADLDAFRASAEGIASGWEVDGLDDTDGNPHIDMDSYPYPLTITSGSSIAIDAGVALPGTFPDRTAYAGDLTIGWQPYSADPSIPVKSSGLVRAAAITTTGNQTFRDTQLHSTPNAAMFIITSAITDNTAAADAVLGIGFATSTSERVAIAQWDDDAVSTTATRRRSIEDGCIVIIGSGGTILAQADHVQFEADVGAGAGVTINWTVAPPAAYLVTPILFCATNAKVGTYLTPAANNGTVSPSIGFPASVIFTIAASGAIPASTASAILSFGVGGANLTQRCWANRSLTAVADAELNAQFINNRISARLQTGGTVLNSTELTAVGATDFTITQRDGAGGTDEVGYLALEFTDENYWIGDVDTPIVTGLQTISAPTIYPQLVIMALTNTEAANTAYTDGRGAVVGISVFTSYAAYCNVIYGDDGAAVTASKSLSDDTAINMPNDDGSAQNIAALSQFTTTGYLMNHTAVAGTAKKMWAFILEGPEESSIASIAVHAMHYARMMRH